MARELIILNANISKLHKVLSSFKFLLITTLIFVIVPLLANTYMFKDDNPKVIFLDAMFNSYFGRHSIIGNSISLVGIAGTFFIWFVSYFTKIFQDLIATSNENNRTLFDESKEIKTVFDNYLKTVKIVFESGIKDFDDNHLLALEKVVNGLDEGVTNIYAIDNSEPSAWWTDTMMGYLAVLSKWKAADTDNHRRTVSRFFICENNDLLNIVFLKTIMMHYLMGFRTYVFSKNSFSSIFDKLSEENGKEWCINKKEVLIWNSSNQKSIDFEINGDEYYNVNCYQSFWDIDIDRNLRKDKDTKWKNYYGVELKRSPVILFEFVAIETKNIINGSKDTPKRKCWEKIPIQYNLLIERLISCSRCCKNPNEVEEITDTNFGIEIKTQSCGECKRCEFVKEISSEKEDRVPFITVIEMKGMLSEYYKKIIRKKL
ncbi:MAG: hypothetical protein V1773_06990 [bacterium]